jgi:hypothetical protein
MSRPGAADLAHPLDPLSLTLYVAAIARARLKVASGSL